MVNELVLSDGVICTIPIINLEYFLDSEFSELGISHEWKGTFPIKGRIGYVKIGRSEFADNEAIDALKAFVVKNGGPKDINSCCIEIGIEEEDVVWWKRKNIRYDLGLDVIGSAGEFSVCPDYKRKLKKTLAIAAQQVIQKVQWIPKPGEKHLVEMYNRVLEEIKSKYNVII